MCAMLAAVVSVIVVALYFKVEKKTRKEKGESCITFSFVEFIDISRIIWIGIFLFIYANEWVCGGFCGRSVQKLKRAAVLVN